MISHYYLKWILRCTVTLSSVWQRDYVLAQPQAGRALCRDWLFSDRWSLICSLETCWDTFPWVIQSANLVRSGRFTASNLWPNVWLRWKVHRNLTRDEMDACAKYGCNRIIGEGKNREYTRRHMTDIYCYKFPSFIKTHWSPQVAHAMIKCLIKSINYFRFWRMETGFN